MLQLGFIGFGEAAFELASGLKQEGLENIVAYDPLWENSTYGALIKERASKSNVTLLAVPEDVLNRATLLFVAVPADKAFEVSQSLKPALRQDCIYIDVSASTPEVKRQISATIKERGASFVDAAMMGPLPVYKHQVPILASGSGADLFIKYMSSFGMNITKVSENPGEASAVKLIRSIYMKGSAALYLELLEAANKYNVSELVIRSISETLDGRTFEETMNRLVTGTSIHAQRRAFELQGSIQLLEAAELNSSMTRASKKRIQELADCNLKDRFQGETPASWRQVIEAIQKDRVLK